MTPLSLSRALAVAILLAAGRAGLAAEDAPGAPFARVDGVAVSAEHYDVQLNLAIRNKFYHRQPPEDQLGALRREVGDGLIDRVLLIEEAKRRKLAPDAHKLEQALAKFEERNGSNPRWQEARERLLPALKQELADNLLLEEIEKSARTLPEPDTAALRAYYDAHHDTFTEPERLRLSVILLKVDPGLTSEEKAKFMDQAKVLHQRLVAGEDFAALARAYSTDETASKGGDMGYVHSGMLGADVHKMIEKLKPGEYSEPLTLMEGVAILRLDERVPPKLKDFEESKERAATLWQREEEERRWAEFKSGLRKSAKIEILDRERYPEAKTGQP